MYIHPRKNIIILQRTTVVCYDCSEEVETMLQNNKLSDLIWLLTKNVMALEKHKIACCGLTISQSHALIEIGQKGEISLIELAEALSLDKSTMSRTVNSLVKDGYVERLTDMENRRYVSLSLTHSGKEMNRKINEILDSYCDAVMSTIQKEKKSQVDESIEILLKSFTKNVFMD